MRADFTRYAHVGWIPIAMVTAVWAMVPSHAAGLAAAVVRGDCSVAPDGLDCRLTTLLNGLYVAAAFLALVLAAVILMAVRIYLKSSRSDGGQI